MYRYFHSFSGIIPARAGFTSSRPTATPIRPDHPRSRGVYRRVRLTRACGPGSSPLARGLLFLAFRTHNSVRIIPARAGFTHNRITCANAVQDHPRSRGVYPISRTCFQNRPGSSPLARGLRRWEPPANSVTRIIPARAGFTGIDSRWHDQWGDHPRSRGVYEPTSWPPSTTRGSSPLARGLRELARLGELRLRIIPARAGFTCESEDADGPCRDHPRSRGVYAD